jgi:hypothetical protein
MGVAGGMLTVLFFIVWKQAFGQRHLGKIQGAAQMLSVSEPTVRKLIRAGKIRLNQCGLVPITEIDRALA